MNCRWIGRDWIFYEHSRSYPLFSLVRCFFHLPDHNVGIFEPSGISRRCYHAACWVLGRTGKGQFPDRHGADSCNGTYRKLGALSAGEIRREQGARVLFKEVSQASACYRRKDELSEGKRMHRCICEQADSDGAHSHLDSSGHGEDGFCLYTVSSVCGIFLWNLTFVRAGYFWGNAAINFFT